MTAVEFVDRWSVAGLAARRPLLARCTLLLLAIFTAYVAAARLYGLERGDLQDWDEGLYAWRAKVAVLEGAWLDQSYWSYNTFYSGSFPPLHIWSMAAMFKIFGFEEWAARLPAALLGVALLVAVGAIGRLMAGWPAAIFATLLVGGIDYIVRYSRMAQFDIPFVAWMYLFVAAYLTRLAYPHRRRPLLLVAAGCMAAGVMTKIALPALAAIAIFLWQGALLAVAWRLRDPRWLNPLDPSEFAPPDADGAAVPEFTTGRLRAAAKTYIVDHIAIALVALALWLPWHLYMLVKHGQEFINWYFGYHLLARTAEVQDQHDGEWWFYFYAAYDRLPGVVLGLGLAALAYGVAVSCRILLTRRDDEGCASDPRESVLPGLLLVIVWIGFIGGLFQSAATKREIYLLPLYAMLGLGAGILVQRFLRRPPKGFVGPVSVMACVIFFIVLKRSGDPGISYVGLILSGQHVPEGGASLWADIVMPMLPIYSASLGIPLALALLGTGIGWAMRRQWGISPAQGRALAISAPLLLLVTVFALHEGQRTWLDDKHWLESEYMSLRPWMDDRETYPYVVYLTPGWDSTPARMHYFYGAIRDSQPVASRHVEATAEIGPGVLDHARRPGGLVLAERLSHRGPEAQETMARELADFENVYGGEAGYFQLFVYRGKQE